MDRLLAQLSQSLDAARTLEDLARPLLEMSRSVTGLESACLTAIDGRSGQQRVLFARSVGALQIAEGTTIPWDRALCRLALDEGRAQCDDVPDRWPHAVSAWGTVVRTYAGVPVRTADDTLFGTLCVASPQRHVIDADALQALRLFARLIGDRIERDALAVHLRRARAELDASSLSDPLTGLPNRRSLVAELARMLARAQRDDRALVVGTVELHGTDAADAASPGARDLLLVATARALEDTLRGGDLVARIGSDAFAVVGTLPRESADASAAVLRERLAAATRRAIVPRDATGADHAGASIGIEVARPGEIDADALIARVECAMHASTRGARGAD